MKWVKRFKFKKPTLASFYRAFTDRSTNYWLSVIALFVIISRWVGHMRFLYMGDSINYALALDNYDIMLQQPHPPGYALYILLAKPIYWLVGDANRALIIVSILFSIALVYAVFYLAREVYNPRVAWIAVFLLMSSPMVWFYGQVAMNYLSDALFASLFGLFAYRALSEKGSHRWLTLASVTLAIGGGFRPTLVIFLGLLWLWVVLRRKSWRMLLTQVGIVVGITLAWLLPAMYFSGGLLKFWHAVYVLAFDRSGVLSFSSVAHGWTAVTRYALLLFHNLNLSLGWGVGFVALFFIYLASPRLEAVKLDHRKLIFWSLWLLPALLFYLLMVFTVAGYLLIVLPAIVVLVAKATEEVISGIVLATVHQPRARAKASLSLLIVVTMAFAGVNTYHYYRSEPSIDPTKPEHFTIRSLDHLWEAVIPTIRREFNPQSTIIGIDSPFMTWGLTHFKYYLPEYVTYEQITWGYYNPDKMTWFKAYHRQTELVKNIELTSLDTKFIVIRDKWSGETSPVYQKVPLLKTNNNIGELLYYDLTDPKIKRMLVERGALKSAEGESETKTTTTD